MSFIVIYCHEIANISYPKRIAFQLSHYTSSHNLVALQFYGDETKAMISLYNE